MKFVRKFPDAETRDEVLAIVDYEVLSYTEGAGVNIKVGEPDPKTIPFYIEDISGSDNIIRIGKRFDSAPTLTIEKSLDGTTWETMGETSYTDITATVPANGRLYLRCNTPTWCSGLSANGGSITNAIKTNGGYCNIGGNIMSLLYGSSFTGNETTFPSGSTYTFASLFYDDKNYTVSKIIDASNLLLPATTLTEYCYRSMFVSCSTLEKAPSILPATELAQYCYYKMFRNCTSLTTAPDILPATELAKYCYNETFYGCSALKTAPVLPATTLTQACYANMFYNCTSLNYIKCLATDISANVCTTSWVSGISSTGTFVKNPSMTGWTTGTSGIPEGWTVEDAA